MSKEAAKELPEFVSRAALAAALDLTPRRISSLSAEGVLPKPTRHGMYPLVACLHAYMRYTRERATGAGVATETLASERAKLTKSKAAIAELEHKRLLGELAPIEQFEAATGAITQVFRSRALALPSRCAAPLAAMSRPAEIAIYLRERIEEMLNELAATEVELIEEDAA